jgi:DNA-binding MarR family transcriptional regulator
MTDLSVLMRKYPAHASTLRTARLAVLGAISVDGVHGIIKSALASGNNTYQDLIEVTPYSRSYLHRHLHQLIKEGQVYVRWMKTQDRPLRRKKLFFLTEKEPQKNKK